MSIFFDALKKAKKDQAEKLFGAADRAGAGVADDFYPALQENTPEEKPEAAFEDRVQEAAIVTPIITKSSSIFPSRPQFEETFDAKHTLATLNEERAKLVALDFNTPASEQFAALRAKIINTSRKQDVRTICVTSSVTSEGKTFVATNLALALAAESERGVIILDADLRRPAVHRNFGIRDAAGLSDYLRSENANIDSVIIDTDKRLAFIPAGRLPKNPLTLLDSEKMKRLVEELRSRYEFVIIDSPPTAPLADADILASLTDGLIFVIRAGQTPLTIVQRSIKMLAKHNILGVVLNGAQKAVSYGYYYQRADKK